ncbi:hypothetical protein H3C61_00705 [Candidatus Gracilibacteria bacterium]|nr:hypothetical protein [Candidatus Gracilibacteria bacterium]
MTDFTKLDKNLLNDLLKKLKLLNSLNKSLGKRGKKEFLKINDNIDSFKVEYFDFGANSLGFIESESIKAFKNVFGLDLNTSQIEFVKNQNLKGGFRIFYNDKMFNMSYSRFENILK